MAARKKSNNALAVLNGDVSSSTLAKAGVEVKLTKSEIAEYIAAKATKQLEEEIKSIEEKYEGGGRRSFHHGQVVVANPPKRVVAVAKAINAADGDATDVAKAVVLFSGKEFGYNGRNRWTIMVNGTDILNYGLTEDEEIPAEYETLLADRKRFDTLQKKLFELRQKNYKVLLVESILSGSVAGTTVLADLDKMVKEMVAAPVAAD